jgi:hypothetical protein
MPYRRQAGEGLNTLRITIQKATETVEMRLEGRLAGPWAVELDRVWVEAAPQLESRKLIINLHDVTYADAAGKQVLCAIYNQTHADLIADTPWSRFLAEEISAREEVSVGRGE